MTSGVYDRRSRGQKGVKEQTSDAKFSTAKGKFECFFFFLELAHVMLLRNPVAKIKKKKPERFCDKVQACPRSQLQVNQPVAMQA